MLRFNRMSELDALGYSINHLLRTMDSSCARESFLIELYKELLTIVVEILNDDDKETPLWDKVDLCLKETQMDAETQLSVFDYLVNFIERATLYFKMMGVIDEVKYELCIKNDSLCVGRDAIKIDFVSTYFAIDKRIRGDKEKIDILDNPTSAEIDDLLNQHENDNGYLD